MADFINMFNLYAKTLEKESPNFYFMLMNCEFKELEDYKVEISVKNNVDEKELTMNKKEITQFISKKLNYNELRLFIRVKENNKKDIIYSPAEKFNYLSNKNSVLKLLKKQFSADINY
jgi:DNA polymerase-3 subunit gamma/tau